MHELTLNQSEARRLTDEVKADAQRLWRMARIRKINPLILAAAPRSLNCSLVNARNGSW
jgi:hypothetical protein